MVHPLDGICAFIGALGFLGGLVATPICAAFEWGQNDLDKIYDKQHEAEYPVTTFTLVVSCVLLIATIVLAFINQAM